MSRARDGSRVQTHGTYGGYCRGCRCGPCREAGARYRKERRDGPPREPFLGSIFEPVEVETEWKSRANCHGMDPEIFFPTRGGFVLVAQRVCNECEVRAECLEFALANHENRGVWGGTSENERRRIRRARARQRRLAALWAALCHTPRPTVGRA